MTIRYFLYARKSQERDDRQVASIEDQVTEVTRFAKQKGLQIVRVFTEAKSAKKPGRPIFDEMVERLRKGEAEGILCWKLNRLARNPVDGGTISWLLQGNTIKHIESSERAYYPTDNVLMMQIDFGIATQYIKDLSKDVKRGLRSKANRGWMPLGNLPTGYMHNPLRKEGLPLIIPDPDRFPILQELWRRFSKGAYSISEIRNMAREMGLRNRKGTEVAYSSLHRIFQNPFYVGYFYWTDENGVSQKIEGKHEPMVSQVQFNQVQEIIGSRTRNTRPRAYDYTYRGLITCGECGGVVTAERKEQVGCSVCGHKFSSRKTEQCPRCKTSIAKMVNPYRLDKVYYACTKRKNPRCTQKSITEDQIDKKILEVLETIDIPEEMHDWMKNSAKQNGNKNKTNERAISTLKNRQSELRKKLDALLEMRLSQEITPNQYQEYTSNYLGDMKALEAEIQRKENAEKRREEDINNYFYFAVNCVERFKNASPLDKKLIIQTFCSNLTILDKTPYFSTKNPLEPVISITSSYTLKTVRSNLK